jgi:hypothetical protein
VWQVGLVLLVKEMLAAQRLVLQIVRQVGVVELVLLELHRLLELVVTVELDQPILLLDHLYFMQVGAVELPMQELLAQAAMVEVAMVD